VKRSLRFSALLVALFAALGAAYSCSDTSGNPTGSGGTTGGGGSLGGTTGGGGLGGTTGGGGSLGGNTGGGGGSVFAACEQIALQAAPPGACLTEASDGGAMQQVLPPRTLATAVTVTSVSDTASNACAPSKPARAFALDGADGVARTLYLPPTVLPADLIQVGDVFDLQAQLSNNLFIIDRQLFLRRNGATLLFDHDHQAIQSFPLPDLSGIGLSVTDDGATCRNSSTTTNGCGIEGHRAKITAGADSVALMTGETGTVGGFSITIGSLYKGISGASCDLPHRVAMTGFAPRPAP
jgi:hypothetical protein